MHPHIKKLYEISAKPSRIIIGLMSGTSLDGLDVAICKISGAGKHTECELLDFTTLDYDQEYRTKIRSIFAKPDGHLETLCLLNAWVGRYHAKLVNQAIAELGYTSSQIDIIASHGQTVYHCPKIQHQQAQYENSTLQIGDGDHIALGTNIITLSDFRQKHIAAGGQGAPLVMYGDYLLFHSPEEDRVLLNIGGIANLSFISKDAKLDTIISSDIGPGNTMMDAYIQRSFNNLQFDKDARIAKQGKVNKALLNALLNHPFFALGFPKTTGPEVFNLHFLDAAIAKVTHENPKMELRHEDVMATLCEFSAITIVNAICALLSHRDNVHIYSSGGGIHNPVLMESIYRKLQVQFKGVNLHTTDAFDINPDAKEAVLFALLANETLSADQSARDMFSINPSDLAVPAVTMGKISFPD
uniref:anhydro-N-acetylmuramic acid kinase n=1 Tax=Ningiella ruwaisensis TaxID=2364274 RepID=UPI00109EEC26|nr:anhydro-N-acetylmuramic acid kinase [Ningiella ruwaisensis]